MVERNIFGLNPPPLVDPNAAVVEPPVKIIPNGIMTIFGQLQVLFKVAGKPPAKDANYILMEGQSQDEIEVVKIDEKAGIVSFNNHGIPQDLPLVVTQPTAPPSAPTGGGNAGFPAMRPGGGTPAGGPAGNNPFMNRVGNRGGESSVKPYGGMNPGGGGNGGAVPSRGGISSPDTQNALSPEANMILTAAEHARLQQAGDPMAALFPPTPIDAETGVVGPTPVGGGTPNPTPNPTPKR